MLKREKESESYFPLSSASHENGLFIRASKLTQRCYDHFKERDEYKQKYTEREKENKNGFWIHRQLKAVVSIYVQNTFITVHMCMFVNIIFVLARTNSHTYSL